ncbi:MAG: nucleoside triphosphate pyrophosphohydrolase [Nitrospiraceae bacterium]|jgi:tetrapyrrole methylase family protein/MazG family protein|nr:nucleoside triphosphate pyrophosphohydrolase [Nitrospiraceae bacterium]
MEQFQRLVDIMAKLRAPGGCPWDREQTHESIKPYLIEETYELVEAIDTKDDAGIREELGDLLLQVVFHADMAKERGAFDIGDVIDAISAKMISRHPHVFAGAKFDTPEAVLQQWTDRKREEGKFRESALDGVPGHLPSLLRAHRLQSRAARVGFDWKDVEDVMKKLDEELREFRAAMERNDKAAIEDELGDVFFSLVNVSRFLRINAEEALRKTIGKFVTRFRSIERMAAASGRQLSDMSLEEMDALWDKAKALENKTGD